MRKVTVARAPRIGEILLARLPTHIPSGHEQEGMRPVVVVGEPDKVGTPRYPQVVVVPVTSQVGAWSQQNALYPLLGAGTGGLIYDSVALLDHLRAVDAGRVVRRLGILSPAEYAPIGRGLGAMVAR